MSDVLEPCALESNRNKVWGLLAKSSTFGITLISLEEQGL